MISALPIVPQSTKAGGLGSAPNKAAKPSKVSTEVPAAVSSSREVGFTDRSTGRFRAIGAAKIERVTSKVFLLSPEHVAVSGDAAEIEPEVDAGFFGQ